MGVWGTESGKGMGVGGTECREPHWGSPWRDGGFRGGSQWGWRDNKGVGWGGGRSPRGFGAHLGNPNEAQRHNEDPKEGSP